MKFTAWRGADHTGPHSALRIDGVLFQRQRMAAITHDGRLEAHGGGRVAGYPIQRRGWLTTCVPARQRQDLARVAPDGRRWAIRLGRPTQPNPLPKRAANRPQELRDHASVRALEMTDQSSGTV